MLCSTSSSNPSSNPNLTKVPAIPVPMVCSGIAHVPCAFTYATCRRKLSPGTPSAAHSTSRVTRFSRRQPFDPRFEVVLSSTHSMTRIASGDAEFCIMSLSAVLTLQDLVPCDTTTHSVTVPPPQMYDSCSIDPATLSTAESRTEVCFRAVEFSSASDTCSSLMNEKGSLLQSISYTTHIDANAVCVGSELFCIFAAFADRLRHHHSWVIYSGRST
mmetsp:Transcript_82512/g.133812  ORF Transcript_82512/g.133812 Transcript_82512/m.133812 type:complete len:216 (-) Transcript_82512:1631-2278(-)